MIWVGLVIVAVVVIVGVSKSKRRRQKPAVGYWIPPPDWLMGTWTDNRGVTLRVLEDRIIYDGVWCIR